MHCGVHVLETSVPCSKTCRDQLAAKIMFLFQISNRDMEISRTGLCVDKGMTAYFAIDDLLNAVR